MRGEVHRAVLDGRAGRIGAEKIAAFPVLRRAHRTRRKAAAAVRANAAQQVVHAASAKGAFEAAYPGLRRIGRQRFIAVFAARSQFQHDVVLLVSAPTESENPISDR